MKRPLLLISTAAACAGSLVFGLPATVAYAEGATSTDHSDPAEIAEIIVTAQKRSERLQDVPISVSAFSGEELATHGVTTSSDLTAITPGLTVTESNSYVQPFIRGIGSTAVLAGEAGSVATYVDGVYMPMPNLAIYDLANISSVEVLKGPQGTLFGRNAAGGTINITTRAPRDSFEGQAEVSAGNYGSRAFRGYVTGPLAERVAGSLAANYSGHDGYYNDLYLGRKEGDAETYSLRGSVLVDLTSELSVTLHADYTRINDPSSLFLTPQNKYLGQTATSLVPKGPYDYVGNTLPKLVLKEGGVSAHVNYDFGFADLVSITAYRLEHVDDVVESDSTPAPLSWFKSIESGHMFSQEVQLLSKGDGPFRWILGGYYSSQEDGYDPLVINGATTIVAPVDDENYALFADGTYRLGDFEFTAGLRGNVENKSYFARLNGLVKVQNASDSWTSFTPRVVLAYHPSHDLLMYVSYSSGFKSGAFNTTSFTTVALKPETTDAYEVGLKYDISHRASLSAAAFIYNTQDIQVQALNPITNLQSLINAAQTRSQGAELNLAVEPMHGLSVQAGVSYLDARFESFPNAQIYVPKPSGGDIALIENVSGNEMVRSPKWTVNLGASYTIDLAESGSLVPSFNVYSASRFFWDFGNRLTQPALMLVNAQIDWHLPGDHLTLGIWGKNLGDVDDSYRSVTPNGFADRAVRAEPSTYGIRLGYRF